MFNQTIYPPSQPKSSNKLFLVVVVLIALLAGFTAAYIVLGSELASLRLQEQGLESRVANLESTQAALLKLASLQVQPIQQVTYTTPSNYTQLYRETVRSIVVVMDEQINTVENIFGSSVQVVPVLGSGFVVGYNNSYYVVTNDHVIANSTNISVTFYNGNSYPAQVVGEDRFSDLAVLSVDAPTSEFHPLPLANSSQLQVGQTVVAIGNPYGLASTLTVGVVSATNRVIDDPTANPYPIAGVIQTSAPINPGNSGGPLLDLAGQVVGVTTAIIANSQGLGFAIPSNILARELPLLVATGKYNLHPYFGISVVSMNLYLARAMNVSLTRGVLVEQVVPNGPAAKAGIRGGTIQAQVYGQQVLLGGDIIVAVNGTPLNDEDSFLSYLELNVVAGESVVFTVYRSGEYLNITVTAGYRPT
ncbi:MAG: trypsin-like peptidase domain-containing protein [Thermoprotei archaeon]